MQRILLALFVFVGIVSSCAFVTAFELPSSLVQQIKNHQADADKIIQYLTKGPGKGQAYARLADLVDTYGPRVSGSDALENAIKYMTQQLKDDGLANVHGEPASIPRWERRTEWAVLNTPTRTHNVSLLGLGTSVATPSSGITAPVFVVSSFDELTQKASQAKGKIVVFNQPFVSYGATSAYRTQGAVAAAKVGAVASLIRSVTPFSIYSPHTGVQFYDDNYPKIPTACITIEDAELMARLQVRGQNMTLHLYMEATTLPDRDSFNTVAEVVGATNPEQIVLVSGHFDSWDVGAGAMDDGGGAIVSWQALSAVHHLGLKPKRTMRLVMWTCEEFGGIGAQQYFNSQANNTNNYSAVMETDMGVFTPLGIQFTGSQAAQAIMVEIGKLLSSVNATSIFPGGDGTDINPFMQQGVPGISLANANQDYFFYHHSHGDTMTVMDSDAMDLCSAVWAVTAYVLADLDTMLPR